MTRSAIQHRQQAAPRNREAERIQQRELWRLFSFYTEDEIAQLPWCAVRAVL